MAGLIWLGLMVILIIIEAITLGLTTIWFAGGALTAFLVSLMGAGEPVQIAVFFVVSFLLLILTRPLAARFMERGREKTNVDSLIGDVGVVMEDIDNLLETGLIKIRGQEWMARSSDEKKISKDKYVIIERISGVKLIVKEKTTEVKLNKSKST